MKAKSQHPVFLRGALRSDQKMDFSALLDKSIEPIGTGSVVAGIGTAMLGMSSASSYLIAAGVLLHLAARFGDCWRRH